MLYLQLGNGVSIDDTGRKQVNDMVNPMDTVDKKNISSIMIPFPQRMEKYNIHKLPVENTSFPALWKSEPGIILNRDTAV